ncbi:LutC/YkgG family protein [Fusobacterium sp.]|uniref:LutC/YkgG family protein n=1 Tax=Fusobacterium sp. TaxID=68766 RepID=UPI000C712DED|nr:lactate utilization protein C [Fusobacterium sp.]
MSNVGEKLYEDFKRNLESVNGNCLRTSKADLGKNIVDIFKKEGINSICLLESQILKENNVVATIEEAGITVHTDHIRLHAETDRGGVSEANHGIAELGTIVQEDDNVDGRIIATMAETYIGIIKESKIVPTYDDIFVILSNMEQIPNFIGFITGPSRTADIECVGTVGVHGPIKVYIIVVKDE